MVTDEDVDDFIAHFGIKGMKWGQRKNVRTARREYGKQQHYDRLKRISDGTASRADRSAVRQTSGTISKKVLREKYGFMIRNKATSHKIQLMQNILKTREMKRSPKL